jgi:hypothetical protein
MTPTGKNLSTLVSFISNPQLFSDLTQFLVSWVCKKYADATTSAKTSEEDFAALNDSTDPALVKVWAEQEAEAQRNRSQDEESMDIYDIKIDKGAFPLISYVLV